MENLNNILDCRKKILNKLRDIILNKIDIIEAYRFIYSKWEPAFMDKDEDYYFIAGIVSETDDSVKGEIRKNFAKSYLEKTDMEEEDYLNRNEKYIKEISQKLIDKYSL